MTGRAHISLEKKLAAALLRLGDIPYEDAKLMTARQICSLYAFDHDPIPHHADGPSEPWNLTPRLIADHRVKTAKVDVPGLAKQRRLTKAEIEFRRMLLAKGTGEPRPASRWPKRKLTSRNDLKGRTKWRSGNREKSTPKALRHTGKG